MTNRAHILLWTDQTAAYLDAIKAAGLADRVAIDTLPRKDEALGRAARPHRGADGGRRSAGLLPVHAEAALGAGDERRRRGLARAARPAGQACTLTCARGTHTESMPENIIGALFYVAKPVRIGGREPEAAANGSIPSPQPLTGKTLGILGPGRHRPGGRPHRLRPSACA